MHCSYCLETIRENDHKNLAGELMHTGCYAEYMGELDQLAQEADIAAEASGEYAGYYDDSQNFDY